LVYKRIKFTLEISIYKNPSTFKPRLHYAQFLVRHG
jgi:hypothetical protein